MGRCAVGLDIGGTKIAAGVVTLDGQIFWRSRRETPVRLGAEAVAQAVCSAAEEAVRAAGAAGLQPEAVGIATGGQVDRLQGRVVSSTRVLPGGEAIDLRTRVAEAVGLPVQIDNDAKAMARAELAWGAARGAQTAVFLTLGTGVGGALAVNGRVVDGQRGFAGHLGHIPVTSTTSDGPVCSCGNRGCLEAYASGTAIAALARARLAAERPPTAATPEPAPDASAVFAAAAQGAPWARWALDQALAALGAALAGLVHALNPEVIVIGGGLSSQGEPWRRSIEDAVFRRVMPAFRSGLSIRLAAMGGDAGLAGAALLGAGWDRADAPDPGNSGKEWRG